MVKLRKAFNQSFSACCNEDTSAVGLSIATTEANGSGLAHMGGSITRSASDDAKMRNLWSYKILSTPLVSTWSDIRASTDENYPEDVTMRAKKKVDGAACIWKAI